MVYIIQYKISIIKEKILFDNLFFLSFDSFIFLKNIILHIIKENRFKDHHQMTYTRERITELCSNDHNNKEEIGKNSVMDDIKKQLMFNQGSCQTMWSI